ncbi:ribbon-helix-helix protein, CopG family [Candidatus Oscillochloris fontis]|uniref:ribbon-helix-helix protein, CopG family n=1 Tax=Candidatus Oscillochloris fontis TaxID=2496868 RepID=UPI0013762696|nr:ribbon-helix-helix protein, CopG family [Candidatus Oscillochloris fontis]
MRKPTTFRLKESTYTLLDTLARQEDLSRTAMFELLVREEAKRRHLAIPLTPRQRAALDSDPHVGAALERLGTNESYVFADPDGGPGTIFFTPAGDEAPVHDQRLAELEG